MFDAVKGIDEKEKKEIANNETLKLAKDEFEDKLKKVLGDVVEEEAD